MHRFFQPLFVFLAAATDKEGLVDMYALVLIHVGTRRLHLVGITPNPDQIWMIQQARNISMILGEAEKKATLLLRDLDTKYVTEFNAILEGEGVEVKAVGPQSPNMNPHIERAIQAIEEEALDKFVVFGEKHLHYLVTQYIRWFNQCRPHQSLDNEPLGGLPPVSEDDECDTIKLSNVACEERLGGVLKHYSRRAA